HRLDVERGTVAEGVIEERGEAFGHPSPAAARSSPHLASAAGRRLGMCSEGHPVTGAYPFSSVRATTVLCTSSGPSPIVPKRVVRYHDSTGRSPEYPSAPHTWMVRSSTLSTTRETCALTIEMSARTAEAPNLSIFHAAWNVSRRAASISV